jgi:hypothetical protein
MFTIVYYIWFERNNRIFTSIFHPPQHTGAEIVQLIRSHLENIGRKNLIPNALYVKYGTCTVNGMAGVPGLCQQRPSFFV